MSLYINKRVVLNGRKFPLTLAEIFQNLKEKYSQTREMAVFPGHGDGHHGNMLVSNEGKITFFDNEYSCIMPSYMDLSKPYYNDLLGMLFYYFHDRLLDYFSIKSYDEGKTTLNLKIKLNKKIGTRMEITKIKLQERRNFLKDSQNYLKLNDYLFMCHTLNKNPNLFPKKILVIFLAFSEILNEFDSFNPESINSYF
jgi:thiamine kinase-like enzyme